MKACLRCETLLPLSQFFYREPISNYTGKVSRHYSSYCKTCNKEKSKDFRKSKEGLFSLIYSGQRTSSKKRGHPLPDYSKEELITWLEQQSNFQSLYDAWVISNYNTWAKPSPDRLDEAKPYTLDNLQLITWGENAASFKQKKVDQGVGDCTAVNQYEAGVLINTYHSLHEAARQIGGAPGNILRCCRGEYKTSKGFTWAFLQ